MHQYQGLELKSFIMKRFLNIFAASLLASVAISCTKDGLYMPDASYDASYDESPSGEPEVPAGGDKFDEIKENDFIKTADQNVSTFSIDADGASYAYMRKCLRMGVKPSPNAVSLPTHRPTSRRISTSDEALLGCLEEFWCIFSNLIAGIESP